MSTEPRDYCTRFMTQRLGRVDELFDANPRGHQMNEGEKGLAQFLIPCRNTAKLFELIEEPFHLLASLVEVVIIIDSGCPIALGRYHRHNVLCQELLTDVIAVIALVHNRMGQRGLGRHLGEPRLKDGALMTVPCGQDDCHAGAFIATARMDCGGPAAPRAAQSLGGLPAVFF